MELGGTGNTSDENLITEASLRAFWTYYNSVMDLEGMAVGRDAAR
jgi:uncharacterized protein with NAD-binding domain and iron-sulfur cluster